MICPGVYKTLMKPGQETTIAVSDFRPLKIYKNFGLPLSTIFFTVNFHADNHFYKYICFKYTV